MELGSIRFLWISATNPAVSMPQLERIRRILDREGLFPVVQDLYLTETAQYADVVLPCAAWSEKTGTFTNVNRTVHLSDQAVEPPGEARSDLDVFLDYSRRMDFRTRSGKPLLEWTGPEDGFRARQECTRGRPCDYTGLSYGRLRGGSGIPWPCNDNHPDGTVRLYGDGVFPTDPDYCESYGHDLLTGATTGPVLYRATMEPGKAWLKSEDYHPPHEEPSEDYPLRYSTGRTVYQFHTRTRTGRSRPLNRAAPGAWIEVSVPDAERLGLAEGDIVAVTSPRGHLEVPVEGGAVMKPPVYLGLLNEAEVILARSFRVVAAEHGDEPDVHFIVHTLAEQCDHHIEVLRPVLERLGTDTEGEEEHRVTANGLREARPGPLGLLLDLQDLYVLVHHLDIMWTMVGQAAAGRRDRELGGIVASCEQDSDLQSRWLQTRTKQAAPQALLAGE